MENRALLATVAPGAGDSRSLIHVRRPPALAMMYVMLPDRSIRLSINPDDFMWWEFWGRFLGWYDLAEDRVRDARISTIFLGLDHSMGFEWSWGEDFRPIMPIGYRPLVFETMIFGGPFHDFQRRYRDCKEAIKTHRRIVDRVKKGQNPKRIKARS